MMVRHILLIDKSKRSAAEAKDLEIAFFYNQLKIITRLR